MNNQINTGDKIRRLTFLGLMTALVVVLQSLGSFIHIGIFSVCPSIVPIVLGAVVCGPAGGAWLGAASAATILFSGQAAYFYAYNALFTIIVVFAKGIASGYVAGLVYKLLSKKNKFAAVVVAAALCPLVNTGIFLLGCVTLFSEFVKSEAGGASMFTFVVFGLGAVNIALELPFNIVLCPAIERLTRLVKIGKE
ncbi:MAG: ECF transporter S component [Ruminococcaceae bacterium]|nr:ECF transporter S component [Oscillospiraceae bacterium]